MRKLQGNMSRCKVDYMCNIVPVPNKNHCSLHCLKTTLVPVQWNNELKQQGDGAGETSRTTNYELHGKGRTKRAYSS